MSTLINNKKALFNYEVLEDYEAGIVLSGAEVKSVKGGQINFKGSYVTLKNNELWLINAHINPYKMATNVAKHNPTRDRKLLLHKKQISSLIGTLNTKGLTILPISVYTKGSLIKIKIGVCRGKKTKDKRDIIKKRESDRRLQRLMRNKV